MFQFWSTFSPCKDQEKVSTLTLFLSLKCNRLESMWKTKNREGKHAATRRLQSWTKSVVNFALSYSQNAYLADLLPLWPLPSPNPGQSCLFKMKNDPAGLQHCFFGGRGSICSCQCFPGLYLETRHGNVNLFFSTFLSKTV